MRQDKLIIKHDCYSIHSLSTAHILIRSGNGWRDYGIYRGLLDFMAISKIFYLSKKDINFYAYKLKIPKQELSELLNYWSIDPDGGLFSFDGQGYTSLLLKEQLAFINKVKERRKEAANTRWDRHRNKIIGESITEIIEVEGRLFITRKKGGNCK